MEARAALVETALEQFSRLGYEGCGVQQICAAAGLTKPTLYHHFGSKRGLLDAVLGRFTAPLLRDFEAVLPYTGDLTKTLTELTRVFFTHADRYPLDFRFYTSLLLAPGGSESRDAARGTDDRVVAGVTDVFREATRDHGNMVGRELLISAAYIGMVNVFGALIADRRVEYTETLVHRAVHQFSHGIYS